MTQTIESKGQRIVPTLGFFLDRLWVLEGVERTGEARAEDFWQVLVEAENWARRIQNRTTQAAQFGIGHRRRNEPPAPRL